MSIDWVGFWSAAIGGMFGGLIITVIIFAIGWRQEKKKQREWAKRNER